MKQLHPVCLGVLSLALLFGACKGNKDETGPYGDLASVRASLAPVPTTFTVDAATGGTFRGQHYTYAFQPNAFRTSAGGAVTGAVTVEALDLFLPSEMIFSRILPLSNGNSLVSGGELRVTASQNGQLLRLAPGVPVAVSLPQGGASAAGMEFFRGGPSTDSVSLVNWTRRDQGAGGSGTLVVSGDTVRLFSDSLGYMNADQFLSNPNYQSFTVTVAGVSGLTAATVNAYSLYDQYKGLWPSYNFSGTSFSEAHVPNIPIHFVVYAVSNGHFYGGIAGFTPATGGTYTVGLLETTPAAFKAQIDAL